MNNGRRGRRRPLRTLAIALTLALTPAALGGCRVDVDDLKRWETTKHGPDKLQAVLYHEKYEVDLRVEAALSLIRMKPRGGRHVGIKPLVDTLAKVTPDTRKAIVAGLVPTVIKELKQEPPAAQAGQEPPPDESFAYKDAAYALLTHPDTVIIADDGLKASLDDALIEWAMADFEHRLNNRSQLTGMEQLLRYLGSRSVVELPGMMTAEAQSLDKMARIVAELGDDETKEKASAALAEVAEYVISDDWRAKKTPELEAANAASKIEVDAKRFDAQLTKFQDEELIRVLGSMKKVGGKPTIDFLLKYASEKGHEEERRQAALAALEGNLDRDVDEHIDKLFEIAKSGPPDPVLDQALRRIGEMPREKVADRLYSLFETDKWKLRRAAAATILQMSEVKHIDEFMGKLPTGEAKGYALPEAISYGALLGDLEEGDPLEKLKPYFDKGEPAQRATALSYFLTHGDKQQASVVTPFKEDGSPLPTCEEDAGCKWSCYIPKEGAKDPEKEKVLKDVTTVGELVTYCILPSLEKREESKDEAEKEKKKDEE